MMKNSPTLYIGLMSGTSADGIDLALVDFTQSAPTLVSQFYLAYDNVLRERIQKLYNPVINELDLAFSLDVELAQHFARAIFLFLQQENLTPNDIIAIGNHGQTIRHRPNITGTIKAPFTLQIGCDQTLATLTGIRVIGQFRRKDMVLGGQGAPLVPAFHQALFPPQNTDIFVVNIGGIANITYLPHASSTHHIMGFDTGPGNALMDEWFHQHHDGFYDKNGDWAQTGAVNNTLLNHMLADDYFHAAPPKSSGREYFNLAWISQSLSQYFYTEEQPENIQATLTALTAHSITNEIKSLSSNATVYLCGGGVLNNTLVNSLKKMLGEYPVLITDDIGINSDALEAMAFAWFAYAYDNNVTGNIPAVTGASKACVLGVNYLP